MKYINAEKSTMLKKLREHLANTPREQLDAEFEALKDLTIDKPTENKDVQMCNALWNLLKILYAQDSTITEVGIPAGEFRDWLKSLGDRVNLQKEQKPVHTAKEMWKEMRLEVYAQASGNRHEPNYSDDSTKMFSLCDIDEIFEKIGDSTVGSLPEEWSEEDEEHINSIFSDFKQGVIPDEEDQAWLKNYLKSPRPQHHWKPSEEQMEAFRIYLYHPQYIGNSDDIRIKLVESLYNDIKKL